MRRIGVLLSQPRTMLNSRRALRCFGRNWNDWAGPMAAIFELTIDGPRATPDPPKFAAELVALTPDLILAIGSASMPPLLQATRTVPIVFPLVVDPVGAGYVDSLARPGGNATGFISEYSMGGKWLELLKEIAPPVTRAAVIRDATYSGAGSPSSA